MVKSKKMSKTSIAVIVLAILLVLSMVMGMTGAWFTDKDSASVSDQALSFGTIGNVSISVTGFTWTNAEDNPVYKNAQSVPSGAVAGEYEVRDVVMPGDTVKGGRISISYVVDEAGEAARDVYYLIAKGGKYYTLSATNGLVEIETDDETGALVGAPGELSLTNHTITFDKTGESLTVTANSRTFAVDYDHADDLDNDFENATGFNFLTITTGEYEIRIVQKDNLDSEEAYSILTEGVAQKTAQHQEP